MAKSLSDRIAEEAITGIHGRNAKNRAAFILQRAEIKEAIEAGHSVFRVWEWLHRAGRIDYGYQAFRRYARQLVPDLPSEMAKAIHRMSDSKS